MKINGVFLRLILLILLTTAVIFTLSDTVKGSEGYYYSVHVSSHKTHSDAEKNVRQFRAKGYDTFYKRVNIPGKGVWYRIYIGRLESRKRALSFGKTLKAAGIVDHPTTHKLKGTGKTESKERAPSNSDKSTSVPVRAGAGTRGIRIIAKGGQELYLYKDYHALVVGVGDYTQGWPDLPGAVKDAKEVASSLKELGFKVKLILDPTSRQLKATLNDIAFGLGMDRNRALLLYYAGHGETLELADGTELGYIIPTDCPLKSRGPKGFDDKAVSMRDIEDLALKVKSKHFLMLFDSCFSGSLFSLVRAAPVDITEKSSRPVRQFITAGEAGEQVPDKSIFKIVFLDGIKGEADLNSDGYVTGSELGMHLQDKVVNYTRGGQHPQYGKINNPKLDKGDFIFALKAPSQPSTKIPAAPSPFLKAEKQRLAEERERLERERQELERLKMEIERKNLEAERKRIEEEKSKLSEKKTPKYALVDPHISKPLKNFHSINSPLQKEILKNGKLRVGLEIGYSPFEMTDKKGKLIGFDIEIAKEMAKTMGVEFHPVNTEWKRVISALLDNEFDIIISGMSITKDRNRKVDFSDPYFDNGLTVLINKKHEGTITSYKDLNSPLYIVTSRRGKTESPDLADTFKQIVNRYAPECKYKSYRSHAKAAHAVADDRADACISEFRNNILSLKKHGRNKLILLEEPFIYDPFGWAIRKGDPEFLNWLNSFLNTIKADGRYDKIYIKWFKR